MIITARQAAKVFWRYIDAVPPQSHKKALHAFVEFLKKRGLGMQSSSVLRAIEYEASRRRAQRQVHIEVPLEATVTLQRTFEKAFEGYEIDYAVRDDLVGGLRIMTATTRLDGSVVGILKRLNL